MKSLLAIIGIAIANVVVVLLLLITLRMFIETRSLPTATMAPTLNSGDKVLLEKVTSYFKRPIARGEIIIFYPPPIELGGNDLSWDISHVLGRLTGLPVFPYDPAFIKRVIGLPGDLIRVVRGQGVFINGTKLDEASYIKDLPNYDLNVLGDIGGENSYGYSIHPYGNPDDAQRPIVVPPGQLFVLGDNRNNSADSRTYGPIQENRVIGRVQLKFFPNLKIINPPTYSK